MALETARRRIWESSSEGKQAFTPGAGVVFVPKRRAVSNDGSACWDWVVGRQPKRREGRHSALAQEPFELTEGQGRVWDNRVWFQVERVTEGGESWRWWVEGKGRWSLPVVMRMKSGCAEGKAEVVLDFSRRGRGIDQVAAEGSLDLGGFRVGWRCRKVLR